MKALILSADNFEDSELLVPYYRLEEAGVKVTVASLRLGAIKGKHGYEVTVDQTFDEVIPDDYAILIGRLLLMPIWSLPDNRMISPRLCERP